MFHIPLIPNSFDFINYPVPPIKECFSNPTTQRIITITIPFLNLYQPTAMLVSMGGGALKSWTHINHLHQQIQQGEWQKASKELFLLALTVSTVAVTILNFQMGLVVVLSIELCRDLKKIIDCFKEKHYQEAGVACLGAMQHSLYLACVIIPHPALIVASVVVQISVEAFCSYQEFKQGHYLEGIAYLVLCGIRGMRIKPQVKELLTPIGGPQGPAQELTSAEVKQLVLDFQTYKDAHPDQTIKFEDFLKSHAYSTHIANANFAEIFKNETEGSSTKSNLFENTDFSGVSFTNCQFGNLNLNQSSFYRSSLTNCQFNDVSLQKGVFKQTLIHQTSFSDMDLSESRLSHVKINESNLLSTTFRDSYFSHVHFIKSTLKFCLFDNSFFHQSGFSECNLGYSSFNDTAFIQTFLKGISVSVGKGEWNSAGADFIRAKFRDCQVDESSLTAANFKASDWQNCQIRNSNLGDAVMAHANLNNVSIYRTSLDYLSLYKACLDHVTIQKCTLVGSFFLDANIRSTKISESDLTDCLLYDASNQIQFTDCTDLVLTRPVIGLASDLDVRGTTVPQAYKAIKKCNAIPVRLDNLPSDIDLDKLKIEVQIAIEEAKAAVDQPDFYSIPNEVLKNAKPGSEIAKIRSHAEYFANHVDAIVVPGGPDVEPEFYGQVREADTHTAEDEGRRSLFEFALFKEAFERECPIIGICRGAQVGAVYHGASLQQHIDGQIGVQDYDVEGGILKTLIGDNIKGLSMHHQGIVNPGPHLTPTIHHQDIIKALEHPNGNTYLFQFHIEFAHSPYITELSQNNAYIFPFLGKLADNYHQKKFEGAIDKSIAVA